MQNLADITNAVRRGERISPENALVLWREAPLWLLGELATERKRKASGESVFYNRNVHLEPSNICLFNCEFCSFRRREGDPDAWYMSLDDIEARAKELRGKDITEVHIVGGVHPKHDLDTYCAMIRRVKGVLPHVTVKAYTAVEIFYMIRHEGISIVEGLRRLKDAGMEAIPGGGAEIFDAELRKKICPDKCSAEEWLAVHRAAHNMGIATNCTMLYGHVESLEQRIDHLERLRKLQDESPGFDAFIPLKYRSRNNRMSDIGECSVDEDLRMIAMSRIYLDNIPHIKAYWVAYGKATTEMALAFGADDIDGTIDDSTKIYSMAGADQRPTMSVEELETLVRNAGFIPVERDTHYNEVIRASKEVECEEGVELVEPQPIIVEENEKQIEKERVPQEEERATNGDIAKNIERLMREDSATPRKEATSSRATTTRRTTQRPTTNKRSNGGFVERIGDMFKRRPIIMHLLTMVIVGIALLVLLHVGLLVGTRHNDTIVVPDFRGMVIDEAKDLASDKKLNIIVRDSIFDVDLPGGTVVDQLPRTADVRDVTVKPGRKIYVTINAYTRRMVDVPYVAKQTLRQALNQIERSGLSIKELIYEADLTSTDYVLRQEVNGKEITPSSNVSVQVGTGVTLYVSYRRDEQHTVVPRLAGLSLAQAKKSIWDSGLNVGEVKYDNSVEDIIMYHKARVYHQSVAQNLSTSRGREVSLYLTCDQELIDSAKLVSENEMKRYEKQRRKAEEQRRKAEETQGEEGAE